MCILLTFVIPDTSCCVVLNYKSALSGYYAKYKNDLSAESKIRLEKNPLRILDSKDYKDCQINQGAPKISQYYTGDATTGQNALNQIRVFKDAVSIGGLVVF